MKGIILAGGTGSRLSPLTDSINKHLLPVGNKPMIYYAIEKLVAADISDICIVTGKEHAGSIIESLGSGEKFGCQFTYKVQERAGGIAEALALTEGFVGKSSFCCILGDNIFKDDLTPHKTAFHSSYLDGYLLLKEVPDPERFGVAELEGDRIVSIEEKPKVPKSTLAVTGIYFYTYKIFKHIKRLKPSLRNELEISDLNNLLIENNSLGYGKFVGSWTDAGTFKSLKRAGQLFS